MAKIVKKSPIPLYGAAAVWLLWAVFLPMYALWHFALVAAASLLVWFGLKKLCPDKVLNLPDPESQPEPEPQPEPARQAPEDPIAAERARALSELRRLDDNIEDEKISQAIRELERTSQAIFQQVREAPEKLPQIRRFMDYYLPTTLKLLNAYDRMSSVGVGGENIDSTKERVEAIMDTIVAAFDKQLDGLFGAEALDVSADITVLETMLAREGLAGDQMKAETTKNADGTDIKLEL